MKIVSALLATALLFAPAVGPSVAWAKSAPQPVKPIAASFYSGRWYEIARTPNSNQRDCQAPTSEFTANAGGRYQIVQTCHRGAPTGEAKVFKSTAALVPGAQNAKFTVTFFGLAKQEYWVLDCSGDGQWAIMATPGGNYVWLLSRRPVMSAAAKAQALARIKALGYDTGRLELPRQLGS
ncbi:apolipoprotein D and lipocalin family protein [Caulobacter ginsengisoli]|uniref:Outer membrane lipoprotein Blc n=1 Tax=Caulobacter ginsengisoli TaxID=400775 RepID=A0ABU0ITU9_9CAUL|nr:lipocalin family protein [Caulobacter ginsengisoli]MDQ0465429.1 apolipoprotein D and lipocalin family protein [Caulobacter ginsengisoli]